MDAMQINNDLDLSADAKPFFGHIADLRRILFYYVFSFFTAVGVVHYYHQDVIRFLLKPVEDGYSDLQFLSPIEPLIFILKVDLTLAFFLTLPILGLGVWQFFRPALAVSSYTMLSLFFSSLVLAMAAATYAYLTVIPIVLNFMNTLVYDGTTTALTAMNYLGFLFSTGFLLIVSFQIPIIIIILSWLKIIDPTIIRQARPYIHTGIVLLCAFITPTTDVISLALIVVPAILFTEIGFLIARLRFWG